MKLLRLTVTLLMLGESISGLATAQRRLVLDRDNLPLQSPLNGKMRWTGERLTGCDFCVGRPILWSLDRQGYRTNVTLDIPQASYAQARDVASGPDGSLVAVGYAITDESRTGTFLAWISPDTHRQVIIRVWPYDPEVVTVAPDGTVWIVGAILNDNHRLVHPNVLRHYTSSGQLLASNIISGVRQSVSGDYRVSSGPSVLMASKDRIGWLTSACQYIEFSSEPVELGRYACPNAWNKAEDVAGIALSSANDLLAGAQWLGPLAALELDRASGTWKPAPVYADSGKTSKILGFDGTTLVTWAAGSSASMRRYAWSDGPPTGSR